jgi:hypothetical protein
MSESREATLVQVNDNNPPLDPFNEEFVLSVVKLSPNASVLVLTSAIT